MPTIQPTNTQMPTRLFLAEEPLLVIFFPSPASSSKPPSVHNLYIHHGSISAPVTPPLSSPTARTPRIKTNWDDLVNAWTMPSWPVTSSHYSSFLQNSTPTSPGHKVVPNPPWLAGIQIAANSPTSPTFSLMSSNPFGMGVTSGGSSRMWTPGQSRVSSPVLPSDVQMSDEASVDFAFGSCGNGNNQTSRLGVVKPWEGEMIHEECGSDELELTLGCSRTRAGT
ncbi:hypothetical protein HPP92_004823 [Vanilla planifolia]|uniref:Protein BZR1 homolog n=1 Tax=Vanilla planifolia TaxID=51239 RepID=A0A835RR21_VANPL|nr:hypothetical protein HPP92_004823 [Vanilla planifolia]